MNPYVLDWGNITPEGFNEKQQEALHVFNFDISSVDKISMCTIFIAGKIFWTSKHIPNGVSQKIVIDLRGQTITLLERARKMKADVLQKIKHLDSTINTTIEILI